MFNLNVMGQMKKLSQMIEDGSFEQEFVPLYYQGLEEGKSFLQFYGEVYPIDYAGAMVSIYNKVKTQRTTRGLKLLEQ